jgi:hypothetical protein
LLALVNGVSGAHALTVSERSLHRLSLHDVPAHGRVHIDFR